MTKKEMNFIIAADKNFNKIYSGEMMYTFLYTWLVKNYDLQILYNFFKALENNTLLKYDLKKPL